MRELVLCTVFRSWVLGLAIVINIGGGRMSVRWARDMDMNKGDVGKDLGLVFRKIRAREIILCIFDEFPILVFFLGGAQVLSFLFFCCCMSSSERIKVGWSQLEYLVKVDVEVGTGVVRDNSKRSVSESRKCSGWFGQDVCASFGASDHDHWSDIFGLVFPVEFHLNMGVAD